MDTQQVLSALGRRISAESLSIPAAARQIGVTAASLRRHLDGAYCRSDSLAKYRVWLNGEVAREPATGTLADRARDEPARPSSASLSELVLTEADPGRRHIVVDLFSGCGGLSLGFDRHSQGEVFDVALALEIEQVMVDVFNENHPAQSPIARQIDLADFTGRAEILAFYLDHLAGRERLGPLADELEVLPTAPLSEFKSCVKDLDSEFLKSLVELRSGAPGTAYRGLPRTVLGQTSVSGFHDHLALPPLYRKSFEVHPLVWSDLQDCANVRTSRCELVELPAVKELTRQYREVYDKLWRSQVAALEAKATGSGRGQLKSSAGKIRNFLELIESGGLEPLKKRWVTWRATRQALRAWMFGSADVDARLGQIYSVPGRQVSVVLGGPPCQGFSRIGRGKIRALRESSVQVHMDPEAGDSRNRLLEKYVLFVGSLRPSVFLFENVAHFKAEVTTPEGVFRADEVLAEAIGSIGGTSTHYDVRSRVIAGTHHGIPQTRERYFMVGTLSSHGADRVNGSLAEWALHPRYCEVLPLQAALAGLGRPRLVGGKGGGRTDLSEECSVDESRPGPGAARQFWDWVRQPAPGRRSSPARVDSHHARATRGDDSAFFQLMGPGTRWMDYRCEGSQTLAELRNAIEVLIRAKTTAEEANRSSASEKILAELPLDLLKDLGGRLDASLSLRLLLEAVPPLPGELVHHLATRNYLAKREGNHGDWLARMDPTRPSKTIVSHMGKDTYAYVHPWEPRMISIREAARIQTFPDWFSFGNMNLVNAFRAIGNAVPPLLSSQLAARVAQVLAASEASESLEAVGS